MMRSRSFIVLILISCLLLSWLPAVTRADVSHQAEAQALNNLGLFKGSSSGFELDKKPTRAEGAVMLVRLLGKETQARSENYRHPFADVPAWASPYVGYMFEFSLTQGSSPTTFSPNQDLSAPAYATFVLRALGYSDHNGDFQWSDSLDKARALRMLSPQEAEALASSPFLRDDMVNLSYHALQIPLKNREVTLAEKLIAEDHAISASAARASGLRVRTAYFATGNPDNNAEYIVRNGNELQAALQQAVMNLQPAITLQSADNYDDLTGGFESAVQRAMQSIEEETGLVNLLWKWRYQGNRQELNVELTYLYNWSQLSELNKKCSEIIESLPGNLKSDYEREKLIHDYIINHSRYDYQNSQNDTIPISSRTAYGVLVLGTGVCQGYAEAFNVLCRRTGLSSLVITGRAYGEDHAWNLIRLAGHYYQTDVTADDPVNEKGTDSLSYTYLNLNDQEMQKDHQWDSGDFPACSSLQYNYHVVNNQYVENYAQFADYVTNALARHDETIELRIRNFTPDDFNQFDHIIFTDHTVSRFHYSINEEQGVVSIFGLEYR